MRVASLVWLAAAILLAASLSGCSAHVDFAQGQKMTGGDPEAGKQAIVMHDCHSCHSIPGIEGDEHVQGPSARSLGESTTNRQAMAE